MTGAEKKFWLFFIILNLFQFLPAYLINADTDSFLPLSPSEHGIRTIFRRDNYDIFRVSVDLLLWSAIFYLFRTKINIRTISNMASTYAILLLVFQIYYHTMYKIFLVEPILFNDIQLAKLGYQNLGEKAFPVLIGIVIFLGLLYFFLFKLYLKLFGFLQEVRFGSISLGILIAIGILLTMNFIRSGFTVEANHEFQIGIGKVIDNLQRSAEAAKNLSGINIAVLNKKIRENTNFSLNKKPDIYLLFFESYGNIVYKDTNLNKLYSAINKKCQQDLTNNGLYSVSDFSLSPVSGGSSWISFTSVMFGFNIRNQGTFLYFLNNKQSQQYVNIFKYFRGQGYKGYWINPMPDNKKMDIPWKLYADFYGVDKWLTFRDMNYHGKLYGFGPVPPDQYSLFRANQMMNQDSVPHIVFYITHNSHSPFICPDSIVQNWQTLNAGLNNLNTTSTFIKKPTYKDYIKAINYDLEALTRFIIQANNKNSIFIVIGDHQPPVLSTRKNSFNTPVHIIGSDSALINSFLSYGFIKGLYVERNSRAIRHEAIYSMLMREIVRRYGMYGTKLPEYFPFGTNSK